MGFSQGYGPADDDTSIATIRQALDLGVTLLDTAMSYGSGHNEILVGRAISGRRSQVQLATKFGIVRDGSSVKLDGHPDRVAGYCNASLGRLGTDVIDLYYLHRVDPEIPVQDTIGAMADLVEAGKVRHLGLSEANVAQLNAAAAVHSIAALQMEWSLLWREPEDDVVPAARSLDIGLVPYSPLGRGMLTGTLASEEFAGGDFRASDPRFRGTELEGNLAAVEAIRAFASERNVTPGQLALAWLLAQGPDVVPIPGTRSPERVRENSAAVTLDLPSSEWAQLERVAPRSVWTGDRSSFAAHQTARNSA